MPVIVVGNITVGGSGKTPLVAALCAGARARAAVSPGIVSRGYGGERGDGAARRDARATIRASSATSRCCSRAPASRSSVGRDRVAAARALLAAHPACDVIVADDGLQHYALARDVEIAVVDAARGLGNGWLLPAGPLREPRVAAARGRRGRARSSPRGAPAPVRSRATRSR